MPKELWTTLAQAIEKKEPLAIITLTDTKGSTPRPAGSKMLLYPNGSFVGTIGGGALEGRLLEEARQALNEGKPRKVSLTLKGDLDMTCGGQVEAFVEVLGKQQPVWIFGAGHVARALTPMLLQTEFAVTVVDDRAEWADPKAFPIEATVIAGDFEENAQRVEQPEQAYVVVMTRDHKNDFPVLRHFLQTQPAYLGVMASRSTRASLMKRLEEEGLDTPGDKLHMPIGLSIGSKTPDEIAVSITAQLIQHRHEARS